jgi:hypothetical protein
MCMYVMRQKLKRDKINSLFLPAELFCRELCTFYDRCDGFVNCAVQYILP